MSFDFTVCSMNTDGSASSRLLVSTTTFFLLLFVLCLCTSHLFLHFCCSLLLFSLLIAVEYLRSSCFAHRRFRPEFNVSDRDTCWADTTYSCFGGFLEASVMISFAMFRSISWSFSIQSWRFALADVVLSEVVTTASEPRLYCGDSRIFSRIS